MYYEFKSGRLQTMGKYTEKSLKRYTLDSSSLGFEGVFFAFSFFLPFWWKWALEENNRELLTQHKIIIILLFICSS